MSLLVNYTVSDESSAEDKDDNCNMHISDSDDDNDKVIANINNNITADGFTNMFSNLPKPTYQDIDLEEPEMIILPTKTEINMAQKPPERKKTIINISIIADSDSDSENEIGPKNKKTKKSGKCDLFNLLPAPKSHGTTKELNRSLVPHVLSSKHNKSHLIAENKPKAINPKPTIPQISLADSTKTVPGISRVNPPIVAPTTSILTSYDTDNDSDNDDNSANNYFFVSESDKNGTSTSTTDQSYLPALHSTIYAPLKHASAPPDVGFPDFNRDDDLENSEIGVQRDVGFSNVGGEFDYPIIGPVLANNLDYSESMESDVLKPRDFSDFEGSNIIDARVDDWMGNYKLQEVKQLTLEQSRISYSKKQNKDMPTSQQKRKHQITYLAYEAKERELELKNQWSENRFTKKQTQSKYGF